MKISFNWLKDIIPIQNTPQQVAEMLTDCGLEVEYFEKHESIKGGLQGVVVGLVTEKTKHPNADKLSICKVNIGDGIEKQIVCGASNVAVGQKVLVATVGSVLYPSKGDSFTINKSKIRGELSEGMICAEDELNLGNSHDGIMVLPDEYEIGKNASDYFANYEDWIFDIGLTANRGDAASHLGVARDLKAITKCDLHLKTQKIKTAELANSSFEVEIRDAISCPRYSGISINNVHVNESPDWIKNRLKAIGINPINNIVDATNYVLHELGQPIHAFDADQIIGKKITVKNLPAGTKFRTLDKIERTLTGVECMICDSEKPLAIAGVFGGIDSGINSGTKNIFIESAYFDSRSVRKTAKQHGLSTDASFRYERGTDPNITVTALTRAANLIIELAGGEISSSIVDIYPKEIKHFEIDFSISKSNKLIGKDISKEEIIRILTALEIEIKENNGDKLMLSVPPYRSDVTRDIDVTEEILRIYGLNNIEIGNSYKSIVTFSETENKIKLKNSLADFLSNNGFYEIATNSLTKSSYYNNDELKNAVKIINPLSSDLDCMRMHFLPSFLEAISYNHNRKNYDLKFYEFGKTYFVEDKNQSTGVNVLAGFAEKSHLTMAICGRKEAENWNTKNESLNYYNIKSFVVSVLQKSKLKSLDFTFEENSNLDDYTSISYNNKSVASFGLVNEEWLKMFDIDSDVYFADINFDTLLELSKNESFKLKSVPSYPSVRRDLALLIDESVNYDQLEKIAYKSNNSLLKQVNVFDVYQGDKIEKGKKSYALSFILQDENKTLTDEEIDSVIQSLILNFEKEAGAILRA